MRKPASAPPLRRASVTTLTVFIITCASSAAAAPLPPQIVRADVMTPLLAAGDNGHITLRDIPLGSAELDSIELEPFSVWAPGASLHIQNRSGAEKRVPPPDAKTFRGFVKGHDDSAVFIRMTKAGELTGMILVGEKRFIIGRGVAKGRPWTRVGAGSPAGDDTPVLISEVDPFSADDPSAAWNCKTDSNPGSSRVRKPEILAAQSLKPLPTGGGLSNATYTLNLAMQTDYELYAGFNYSTTAVSNYLTLLVGEASVIYQRDVKTSLQISGIYFVTSPNAINEMHTTPPSDVSVALAELGTYWHNNYSGTARSAVVMVSGKSFNSGMAWEDAVCGDDFACGSDGSVCGSSDFANAYGGAYAFVGSSGAVSTSVPDPTAVVNGVQYALPLNANYWMLLAFCHEVGHLCNGPHTNCVTLTPSEQTLYGVNRAYVDLCEGSESGCYGGTSSAPPELGTIMSACQNFFGSGGYRQSRYVFGKSGEASSKIPPYLINGIDAVTPAGNITLGTCGSTQSASVQACSGCTYSWALTAGTINSGQGTASVNFTASGSNATLSATITNSHTCAITASIPVGTCLSAPLSVTALAISQAGCGSPSVQVTWAQVTNATGYNIYRCSTDHCANINDYVLVGSTASVSFIDNGCRTDLTPPAPNAAFLYEVAATSGGGATSPYSAPDLATTILFTDDPILTQTQATRVRAVHVSELRTAVNAVCTLAGTTGPGTPPAVNDKIGAGYLNNLRTLLDAARAALSLPARTYQDNPLNPAGGQPTVIRAPHITDLRNGVK